MPKISTHLWFDKEAKEAAGFYTGLFENSKIKNTSVIDNTPSGSVDIITIELSGQEFTLISAGPFFKFNPAISFFVAFDSEKKIQAVWDKLIEGGQPLMPFDSYPWAKKYGWVQDRYGLSWQLSYRDHNKFSQKITPMLMFVGDKAGKTREAIEQYTGIFPDSKIEAIVKYEKDDKERTDFIKHAEFSLNGSNFMAMDSSFSHKFAFNEAISFMVHCASQKEIDYYWEKLSYYPESEQCGWLKDKYGVSWQIVPTDMDKMMAKGSSEQIARVTESFLKMKKFDLAALKAAYQGNKSARAAASTS